ncbi:Endopeptidase lytE [Bacillus cereus Rock4-18]|nr:Endopeptidase lytE [Bacillus cereus Rock4-18]
MLAHAEKIEDIQRFIYMDEVQGKRSWKRQLLFLMGLYAEYNVVYCFVKSRE